MTHAPALLGLIRIAGDAGRIVMRHYADHAHSAIAVARKDDASPVTEADLEADRMIRAALARDFPATPVISEETGAPAAAPGETFFLVDPLDGTKEFLKRNGEFTINIALIEAGAAVAGVVYAPALGRLFAGAADHGAFELHHRAEEPLPADPCAALRRIRARAAPPAGLTALVSRSHADANTEEYLAHYRIAGFVSAGSSLKFCVIAAGGGDIYPRHGTTMEWDTAAGHAVLAAAGGRVTRLDGTPLHYGKASEGFRNPHFVAWGLPDA